MFVFLKNVSENSRWAINFASQCTFKDFTAFSAPLNQHPLLPFRHRLGTAATGRQVARQGGPLAPPSGGGTRAEICQVAICARQKTYYKDAPCQITESDCDPLVFPHLAIRYSDVQILHRKINFILTELLCYSSRGFPARFNQVLGPIIVKITKIGCSDAQILHPLCNFHARFIYFIDQTFGPNFVQKTRSCFY